jgi:hypothetical protein
MFLANPEHAMSELFMANRKSWSVFGPLPSFTVLQTVDGPAGFSSFEFFGQPIKITARQVNSTTIEIFKLFFMTDSLGYARLDFPFQLGTIDLRNHLKFTTRSNFSQQQNILTNSSM